MLISGKGFMSNTQNLKMNANDEGMCFRYFMLIQNWNSSLLRQLVCVI
jgi:hypothetical protein